ncbi:unnamed protein product [Linum tenue]|uniref:Uncharacterized protein n=1 Tax=Linum tenue TaxID=586396 RepID=A0AAV0L7K2_9ROSI|nr:unnamed protein product [Linum tenue]
MVGYRDFLDTRNRTHGVSQTTSLFTHKEISYLPVVVKTFHYQNPQKKYEQKQSNGIGEVWNGRMI